MSHARRAYGIVAATCFAVNAALNARTPQATGLLTLGSRCHDAEGSGATEVLTGVNASAFGNSLVVAWRP